MRFSRGRFNQYELLKSDKEVSNYLVEKALFSEASFFHFIEKYKVIVIKPAFGPGEICVSVNNDEITIKSISNSITFNNKQEAFRHLLDFEVKQKYQIVQEVKTTSRCPFMHLLTVHRKSPIDKWQVVSKITNQKGIGCFVSLIINSKIIKASILAAEKLGIAYPLCQTIVIEIVNSLNGALWIQDTILHGSTSKWSQYQTLLRKRSLRPFIPHTELLTKETMDHFLSQYNEVILKPCIGQQGNGIIQISQLKSNTFKIHFGIRSIKIVGSEETFQFINEHYLLDKYYLVQQKIQLATINQCPMDVRVITQKINSTWKVTGKLVRIAANNFIITNAAQKLLLLEDAIRNSSLYHSKYKRLEQKIDKLSITAAQHLELSQFMLTIIGFDIGVTHDGQIWIIEGNYVPSVSMFNQLEDKKFYKDILDARKMSL
ncbi:YheC/YheD family protein [Sporosarcina sp. CAU 1771]